MLGDLGLYSSTFSPRLLEETGAFYKGEGLRLMEATDMPHYLTHCEVRHGPLFDLVTTVFDGGWLWVETTAYCKCVTG
jgi:hypothetical protein